MSTNFRIYIDPNTGDDTPIAYKGHSYVETAAFYCPLIPLEFLSGPMWQRLLDQMHYYYSHRSWTGTTTAAELMHTIYLMQADYPGNYIVVENYNEQTGKFAYSLEFDSDEDRVEFMQKYGN